MSINQSDEGFTLSISADSDWMNSAERVFPVVIDPTLLIDVGALSVEDTYVDNSSPSNNFCYDYYLYAGMNSLGKTRTYVRFPLPDLPNCSVVIGAKLHLAQNQYDPGSGQTAYLNVYDLSSTWNCQTITWNNQPSSAYSGSIIDYTSFKSGTSSYNYELDITKIVKKWYEQGSNNGLMLASSNESVTKRIPFLFQ